MSHANKYDIMNDNYNIRRANPDGTEPEYVPI